MNKKCLIITGLAAFMLLPTSCMENEFGSVDLTMPETPTTPDVNATYTFNHPCAMYTADDFARVKTELDGNTIPEVSQAFAALKSSGCCFRFPACLYRIELCLSFRKVLFV